MAKKLSSSIYTLPVYSNQNKPFGPVDDRCFSSAPLFRIIKRHYEKLSVRIMKDIYEKELPSSEKGVR
jgi:hypothetical protein